MYENNNEGSARVLEQCKDAFNKQQFESMETQIDELKKKLDQSQSKTIELEKKMGWFRVSNYFG